MTSASDPASTEAGALHRLHPLSWLFELLAQLRQMAFPLIALLFFGGGRGEGWQMIAIGIGAAVIVTLSVWRYFTYGYRIDADALVIRSGLLHRETRHLPFSRLHNVELRQSVLHRLASVAEVRIESATGGNQAEAQMRVLALPQAQALAERIRSGGQPATAADAETPAVRRPPLAECSTIDLIWLGLSSNRGWVVLGAAMGLLWQFETGDWWRAVPGALARGQQMLGTALPGLAWFVSALVLLALASLLLRLLGVVLVLLRYHDFRLSQTGDRIDVEHGLLTRTRSHTSVAKIQRWSVREPWLLRRVNRRALHIETAASHDSEDRVRGIDALLPAGPAARIDGLLQRWLPDLRWEHTDWHPIHPRAWRRMARQPLAGLAFGALLLSGPFGGQALALLLLAVPILLGTRRAAAEAAYSIDAHRAIWRQGWLYRRWWIVERERIQAVRLRQSFLDRRAGMAHIDLDTAGARGGPTTLSYLPEAEARRIVRRLRRWLTRPPLLAPEGRGQQHQDGEHLQPAEQHAEGAEPDRSIADLAESDRDPTQPGADIGQRGDGGTEGR